MILILLITRNMNHSGFCFYIKSIIPDKKYKPIIYTKKNPDDNIPLIFVQKLEKVTNKIYEDFYLRSKSLNITQKQYKEYLRTTVCNICKGDIPKGDKVCDHCHFTGEYRGAAHRNCNLQCRKPLVIPVIFHNLQRYDAHLFIKQLTKIKGDFTCIPSTEEKYISFSKKIKVDEYQKRKSSKTITLNLNYDLLIHLSFFKPVLPIS